ncbi:hypothetical protein KDH_17130 [Dictyobacter sp. S3.2.2.5]|uniref:Uncharacterized protein n=2 Tax=Dictyobacter TaxID=2024965 RepID=A0A401ZPH9_9CHLR|nr:hypothetical protein [Dictyobacter aurantiacus]GCE08742.1 hypothetical protein KDAU_60710 [Dictyobacter aurantiacus]GLV54817.1 hypothetical protein KDH_16640 [Dictyobacter sp. S3.2.2.5]GLV54866.1 hypothetical protein KDH_17130 [Dictyobacter sp. S3.2.2.5]
MIQFKKGMMVFNQVEQTTGLKFNQAAQQRVVLGTQIQQVRQSNGRMFKKGMMVGSTVKGLC